MTDIGAEKISSAPTLADLQRMDPETLLTRIMFAEAANQYRKAPEAMEGVGWTIANRMKESGRSLAEVVGQKEQYQGIKDNLWRLAEDPTTLEGTNRTAYLTAQVLARGILNGERSDPTSGATHYFSSPTGRLADESSFQRDVDEGRLVPSTSRDGKNFGVYYFFKRPGR